MPSASKSRSAKQARTFSDFVAFLKRYLKAWPAFVACVVGPASGYFHVFPIYAAHEKIASGAVSIYGFLFAVALFHYQPSVFRRGLAGRILPAVLIAVSVIALISYTVLIQNSLRQETDLLRDLGVEMSQLAPGEVLARTSISNIPSGTALLALYLVSFLSAETSLVSFALAAYLATNGKRTRVRAKRSANAVQS